jgi:hypothetical protein
MNRKRLFGFLAAITTGLLTLLFSGPAWIFSTLYLKSYVGFTRACCASVGQHHFAAELLVAGTNIDDLRCLRCGAAPANTDKPNIEHNARIIRQNIEYLTEQIVVPDSGPSLGLN